MRLLLSITETIRDADTRAPMPSSYTVDGLPPYDYAWIRLDVDHLAGWIVVYSAFGYTPIVRSGYRSAPSALRALHSWVDN